MRVDLKHEWLVRSEELACGTESFREVLGKSEEWLETDIPCDVREPLIRQGIIKEPLEGMHCFDSEWVENKSWWFKKTFAVPGEMLTEDVVELHLASLDYGADVFLNGEWLGHQPSVFFPFVKDVKSYLSPGDNVLLIRLTTGLEKVQPEDMAGYAIISEEERRPGRGDRRRGFLRKPQYNFGWDWNPRVATCGIMKEVWLESHSQAALRWVRTWVDALEPEVRLGFEIEMENFHPFATLEADVKVSLSLDGSMAAEKEWNELLRSGKQYISLILPVKEARLWWPNGMGDQPLYTVEVSMTVDGRVIRYPGFTYGIRTLALDGSKQEDGGRVFAFVINGVRVFCKGANWIPADSLYGRVTDARYDTLIREAQAANFNMLRIWGGGLYERDIFYNLCDRYGIMLWHDFMFACSEYPDDQSWFMDLVEKELDYQTRRLCNHPALVLWCGNNENHWGFDEWQMKGYFGSRIYNVAAPAAVRRNCPHIPYWNSSPYGGAHPNSPDIGDRHHWHDCMMNPDMEKRIVPEEYDRATSGFISEYGYVGPLKRSSVEKYMGGAPLDVDSDVWQHHTNTFEAHTVAAGIRRHYADPEGLDIDRHLLYAGLCQGLMYGYSLEAFRYRRDCFGGLFWMYNDCWGETGWTIIDYYLTRKIPYYFVKRALAPVKFILRQEGQRIHAVGINETPDAAELELEYGFVSFDGKCRDTKTCILRLPPCSRETVLQFDKVGDADPMGVYFVKTKEDGKLLPALLRTQTFREMKCPPAAVSLESCTRIDEEWHITVHSEGYAHAVHFNLPDGIRLSDDYFDLLPNESRHIVIYQAPPGFSGADLHPVSVQVP